MKILKLSVLCMGMLLPAHDGLTCTTFLLHQNGHLVFGRNYDWVTGSGTINTNQRGLAKTSFPMLEGSTVNWVSKFGSITFNQYGKEFPTGGMNEKGLVVELMWLDETKYPSPDSRPAINVLQWIQYQLDNCETVEEVIATDKKIRIATIGTTPLHYLVADKYGKAATIEFLQGKMIVHQGKDLRFVVLTNDTYKQSLEYLGTTSGSNNRKFGMSSLDRFAKACAMVESYKQNKGLVPATDYAFQILKEVSQGEFTKWSIVYNITEGRIYYTTNSQPKIKSVDFSSFNFGCNTMALSLDINNSNEGNISKRFVVFSDHLNKKTIQKSFLESQDRISVPSAYADKIVSYSSTIGCR